MYETPTDPEGEFSDGMATRLIFLAASMHACSCTPDVSGTAKVRSSMLAIVNGDDDIDRVDDETETDDPAALLGWRWTNPHATWHCNIRKRALLAFMADSFRCDFTQEWKISLSRNMERA